MTRRHLTPLMAGLALLAALLVHRPAVAQTPEMLAPPDTAIYVHIHQPGAWFADLVEGPIGEKIRDEIETQEGSGDLLAVLGMNLDEFMDAYFGSDVVVLSPGGDEEGVIFTKVSEAKREHAIDSLELKRLDDLAGYPLYIGPDGEGYFVMMEDWVAMSDASAADYLKGILTQAPTAPRLANTEFYRKWTAELPPDRSMTMLVYEGEDNQHAMGVVRKGKGMDATYLGTSPDFDEMMSLLGETEVADFGPLPASTISAVSFNLNADPENAEQYAGFDSLLAGKSFVNDVLPKLDPPTLLFMGSVKGDSVDPKVGVEFPVAGLALKMNDASVAQDLSGMMGIAVAFSNLAVLQFEAGPVPQRAATYNGASYQVAEVGKPIAQGLEFPEIAPTQIVYGQVGDYFVICSQETFFKQCVDANAGNERMRIEVEGPSHRLAKTPVLAMTARPDGFGELMRTWVKMLDEKGLPDTIAGEEDEPIDTETLMDVVRLFQQYSRMKMQVWSGDDGLVIGRAQLVAPQ